MTCIDVRYAPGWGIVYIRVFDGLRGFDIPVDRLEWETQGGE